MQFLTHLCLLTEDYIPQIEDLILSNTFRQNFYILDKYAIGSFVFMISQSKLKTIHYS